MRNTELKKFLNFDRRKGSNWPILTRPVINDLIACEIGSVITDPVKFAYLYVTTNALREKRSGNFTNISTYPFRARKAMFPSTDNLYFNDT
jgi:hypothetical protein